MADEHVESIEERNLSYQREIECKLERAQTAVPSSISAVASLKETSLEYYRFISDYLMLSGPQYKELTDLIGQLDASITETEKLLHDVSRHIQGRLRDVENKAFNLGKAADKAAKMADRMHPIAFFCWNDHRYGLSIVRSFNPRSLRGGRRSD